MLSKEGKIPGKDGIQFLVRRDYNTRFRGMKISVRRDENDR